MYNKDKERLKLLDKEKVRFLDPISVHVELEEAPDEVLFFRQFANKLWAKHNFDLYHINFSVDFEYRTYSSFCNHAVYFDIHDYSHGINECSMFFNTTGRNITMIITKQLDTLFALIEYAEFRRSKLHVKK